MENLTGTINQIGYINSHRYGNLNNLQVHWEKDGNTKENLGNLRNAGDRNQGNLWFEADNLDYGDSDGNDRNRNENGNTINTIPMENSLE